MRLALQANFLKRYSKVAPTWTFCSLWFWYTASCNKQLGAMSACDRAVFPLSMIYIQTTSPLRLTQDVVVNCLLSLLVLGQTCLDWSAMCILFSLGQYCKGVASKAHCRHCGIQAFTLLPRIPCSPSLCTISVNSRRHWLSLISYSSLDGSRSVVTVVQGMMHTQKGASATCTQGAADAGSERRT